MASINRPSLLMNGSSRRPLLSTLLAVAMTTNVASVLGGMTQNGQTRNHFVLIHGASHGAWCWYKVITLLQSHGNNVTTIDLTSNGINKVMADQVTSVAQYVKPLTDFLASNVTNDDKKVILVGHSLGGSAISYAMESFPNKIKKAIFLAALMPSNGQSFVPTEISQGSLASLLLDGVLLLNYGNVSSSTPTSIYANLTIAKDFFYNRSPIKDVNLALTLLEPTPYAPLSESLTLTQTRYGSIKRYYIRTTIDRILEPSVQAQIVQENPPDEVFTIQGSDHSAFFSYPKALSTILISIAQNQSNTPTPTKLAQP